MQMPMSADFKRLNSAPVHDSIHCAVMAGPSPAEQHKRAILRYFVVAIAVVAVFLLLAIALYYTQVSAGPLVHASASVSGLSVFASRM